MLTFAQEAFVPVKSQATVDDLYHLPDEGKAELINGEVVLMSPTGRAPGYAGDEIFFSLRQYSKRQYSKRLETGLAVGDNKGFVVDLPHRKSFSPDAAFYVGPNTGMKFFDGPPIFAAEVRSEGDYGKGAEEALAAKRDDYFAAGTLVLWDVDLLKDVVRVYRADDPSAPTLYRRGDVAEAEPAVPGWRMPVDDLFE
jgi:Uma2 family endonuclease